MVGYTQGNDEENYADVSNIYGDQLFHDINIERRNEDESKRNVLGSTGITAWSHPVGPILW